MKKALRSSSSFGTGRASFLGPLYQHHQDRQEDICIAWGRTGLVAVEYELIMTLLCVGRGQGEAAINIFCHFYFLDNKIIVELACEWDTCFFLHNNTSQDVITERNKKSHVPSTFRLSLFTFYDNTTTFLAMDVGDGRHHSGAEQTRRRIGLSTTNGQ